MSYERANYIRSIISGVMSEEFYSKIIPRIKARGNRVYLGTMDQESAAELDRANDLVVLELFFTLLNCQSTETLSLKAAEILESEKKLWSYKLSTDDTLIWVRKPQWNLPQAALLSMGLIPEKGCDQIFEEKFYLIHKHRHPILPKVAIRLDNLLEHENAGTFSDFSPSEFIRFFVKYDYDLPEILEQEVTNLDEPRAKRREINRVSHATLLKMIAGMSIEAYEFDPQVMRSNATQRIKSDLEKCGINLDPNTIRNCLRAASKMVHPDRHRD